MKKNNMCQMIALMSGIGMFALPTLANASNPGGTGSTNVNASAAKGNKTLRPTTTQNQQDVPSQQMGGYTVTDVDGNGIIDTADLSLLLVRLGTTGNDVVTTDNEPASVTNATASVAGMQGLYAKNYLLAADGSAATGGNAYYSVMDVYVKYNSAVGVAGNGERIVSFFGQATTDASTYGVNKSAKYENSAGLAFQHSNGSWLPGSTANGGTGNNTWDSFGTIGSRIQGAGNTGGVNADSYFTNPNADVGSIIGGSSGSTPVGAGWYQSAPTAAGYETNAGANADKLIMIGRFTLKVSDIVANGSPVKMTVWGTTTGKSTAQTGGTTMYTVPSVNLKSDAQTKYTTAGKVWTFNSTFDGLNGTQEAWTFSSGYTIPITDCNGNGISDYFDIANGYAQDCNGNAIPDSCDIASGAAKDCNSNGIPDSCDIASGLAKDCDSNGIPDSCDIASGLAKDCNGNGIPDACDITSGLAKDCNNNSVPDSCDIASGLAKDCNSNGIPDACDISSGYAQDCNTNSIPDSCDLASGSSRDSNSNGTPDECEPNPVLALTSNAAACNPIGAAIQVDATLSGVVSPIVAGQVYIAWNSLTMNLNSITAGDAPFNEMHIINQTAGTALILVSLQQGGSAVSVQSKAVARLHFTVAGGSCDGSGTDIQFFPDGTLPTQFTDGVGGKMVPALVASSGFKVDDGAPVLSNVPANVTVQAEAGMGSFANVALTPPTATDACAPGLTASSSRSDGASLNAAFPVGTTTVTWSATDPCGNVARATTSVTVNNSNTSDFSVSYTNSGSYAASSARLLTLNIHGANGYTLKASQPVTLVNGAATISLTDLAVDTYDCVAIEEKGRSLRRVATVIDGGLIWNSTATLVAGDLINDEVVDVLDWGAYIVGNPNADLDGNGMINVNDGNIIIGNFGQQGETGCGTSFMSPPEPLSGISVAELVDRGLTDLVSADLNNDGWLDMEDVRMANNGGHMNKDGWVDVAVVRNAN